MFNKAVVLAQLETLRQPNGAFIAAPGADYNCVWGRDMLYAIAVYWYLGDHEKLRQGMGVMFDMYRADEEKIRWRIASPDDAPPRKGLRVKKNPLTLQDSMPPEEDWGDDQLDIIGLFLHFVADYEFKNIGVFRDQKDREIVQLLVYYLRSVEYWQHADNGMWEEEKLRRATSIGICTGGLQSIKHQRIALVPDSLIERGDKAFQEIFPYESRDLFENCKSSGHCHDRDASQLALLWPLHFLSMEQQDIILARIIDGVDSPEKAPHTLVQKHGLNRYWGDNWKRSDARGKFISAEWPMFKFWLSIIYSDRHQKESALHWFEEGCRDMTEDKVPELYRNSEPNEHTPLAWGQALALIAFAKLPPEAQKEFDVSQR